jgi:hypothetical protein
VRVDTSKLFADLGKIDTKALSAAIAPIDTSKLFADLGKIDTKALSAAIAPIDTSKLFAELSRVSAADLAKPVSALGDDGAAVAAELPPEILGFGADVASDQLRVWYRRLPAAKRRELEDRALRVVACVVALFAALPLGPAAVLVAASALAVSIRPLRSYVLTLREGAKGEQRMADRGQ